MPSLYVIAGEASGDIHGSYLLQALRQQCPDLSARGRGGPLMAKLLPSHILDWIAKAAVVGVWEVAKSYGWFRQQFNTIIEDICSNPPDILLLIDYPGMNLRVAKTIAKKLPQVRIVQYVAPQVWAWNAKRVPTMAKTLDTILCLFPFEPPFFQKSGLRAVFVGHPLVDELEHFKPAQARQSQLIGLFPGSRNREVSTLFPIMLESAKRLLESNPQCHFEAVGATPTLLKKMKKIAYQKGFKEGGKLTLSTSADYHSLMQRATCALVASGTATLEAAYWGLPYALVYKTSWFTWLLGKILVKLPYIGLVNILAQQKVVEEFLQADAEPGQLANYISSLVENPQACQALTTQLLDTARRLGDGGCHQKAASEVLSLIKSP